MLVAPRPHAESRALQLGAQGSLTEGLAPGWAPGGALFAELRSADDALAGRLSLQGALSDDTVAGVDIDALWLAGRIEGCVFQARFGPLALQPCAGIDLGLLHASSSGGAARSDRGFWGAGLGLLRASLGLQPRLAFEAQIVGAVPFVRYSLGSSSGGDLFRTEPVIVTLALGARWAP